ncbi:hypothetical protein [Chitinophaga niabensis]|uniref:Uncharacterized protein n=1 Tax=Chitinophaga niabensis TaxID=536979 RepID=A0A1N6KAE5_9BACT|nr:hypothetical protein [Chitinophaga niabensis]SIO53525.1 hypothetical protein SAMN04488055_5431 [Chitinophaga niabensis]
MYYIKKYSNGWAVHDDVTGAGRLLNENEVARIKNEFPSLADEKVLTVFSDHIRSIQAPRPKFEQEKAFIE